MSFQLVLTRSNTIPHTARCKIKSQTPRDTVYPKKYAHGFVVLCFVVVMQSFIMNSHEVFIHIHQGCFAGTGAIARLPQCQWSKPDGYGKISQCITTTKHSKAKTVCIFLGIWCISPSWRWKHFPRYWSFVRGILASPEDNPHKNAVMRIFDLLLINLKTCWIDDRVANDLKRHVTLMRRHSHPMHCVCCAYCGRG